MNVPRKILVPVDFSEGSEAALDYAAGLARRFAASVELLHVLPEVRYLGPALEETRRLIRLQAHSSAREKMGAALSALRTRRVGNTDGAIVLGDPTRTILERLRESGADLVVMGTHGRTGVTRVLLGSVAEAVVRAAPCPVLVIHPPPNRGKAERLPARKGARP